MGISTFAHLVTDEEASIIKLAPDSVINKLISELCKRPCIPSEGEAAEGDQAAERDTKVSVMATLHELLSAGGAGGKNDTKVYLEQGTKFWSATLSGMFVSVKFGKKGTDGQENSHSGPDAKEYFDSKVNEKLRKGYKKKDPDATAKGAAISALEKLAQSAEAEGESEPAAEEPKEEEEEGVAVRRSKRRAPDGAAAETVVPAAKKRGAKAAPKKVLKFPDETSVKRRVDMDKCGALVGYLLSKTTAVRIEDEDEMLFSILKSQKAGDDVCFGPAYLVSAEETAKFAKILEDKGGVTKEKIATLFDDAASFPKALGALCDVTKERDLEYATVHALGFAALLKHAVQLKSGLLLHFW
mmetsp:Transcript_58950/g.138626  ORF Transcript_58950/g.138626 Transcript_58950/m.138626 type:complete len:356 (+) Transcript_58950:57-1124(+)